MSLSDELEASSDKCFGLSIEDFSFVVISVCVCFSVGVTVSLFILIQAQFAMN